jgi:deoxyribodipyrimidine photo-lyase
LRASTVINRERIAQLNSAEPRTDGDYVLYWMQAAARAEHNPALEFAVQQANLAGLPLVVAFCLTPDFPEANLRHYTFLLEGLVETLDALRRRKAYPVFRLGDPSTVIPELARKARLVVLDKGYLRIQRTWYDKVVSSAECRVYQVEGEAVVPVELASTKAEYAARTIRPRIHKHLEDFLFELRTTSLDNDSSHLEIESLSLESEDIAEFLNGLDIDRSVKPVSQFFKGGTVQARTSFSKFLDNLLPDYDVQRNQPQTNYTSLMSPYLHYGQISAVYLSVTMLDRCDPDDENVKSYLEELIVRRGLSQNFTHFVQNYDSFDCLPEWAHKTMAEHKEDERPDLLTRDQLEAAQSHDPYWNAAQVEMVETGYMHNYMRMYWGKKILEWSATHTEAYETTLYLNNKYFLDGRDPASFGNVGWIYGLHDRAWQERAIYGKLRCMMASGLERKLDPKGYVEKVETLTGRDVQGKDWLC